MFSESTRLFGLKLKKETLKIADRGRWRKLILNTSLLAFGLNLEAACYRFYNNVKVS